MNKIYTYVNDLVFLITQILFSIIPVAMMLGGFFIPIVIISIWYFNHQIVFSDIWFILIGLLVSWMGFKWDDAVIEHYPTAVERKKNSASLDQNKKN